MINILEKLVTKFYDGKSTLQGSSAIQRALEERCPCPRMPHLLIKTSNDRNLSCASISSTEASKKNLRDNNRSPTTPSIEYHERESFVFFSAALHWIEGDPVRDSYALTTQVAYSHNQSVQTKVCKGSCSIK
jgi:hypothetical protein